MLAITETNKGVKMRVVVHHKDIFTGKEVQSDVVRDCTIEGYGSTLQDEVVLHLQMSPTKKLALKLTVDEAEQLMKEMKECIEEINDYQEHREEREKFPCP